MFSDVARMKRSSVALTTPMESHCCRTDEHVLQSGCLKCSQHANDLVVVHEIRITCRKQARHSNSPVTVFLLSTIFAAMSSTG